MGRRPYPRNDACPCGSDKKYKRCCYAKSFHYFVDEATGDVLREVPLGAEMDRMMREALQAQREKFVVKFGREPGPDDRIFFDIDQDEHKQKTVQAMRQAGIRPALIYAYEQTGLIVTEANRNLIPDRELAEFEAAVEEFYDLHPEEDPDLD